MKYTKEEMLIAERVWNSASDLPHIPFSCDPSTPCKEGCPRREHIINQIAVELHRASEEARRFEAQLALSRAVASVKAARLQRQKQADNEKSPMIRMALTSLSTELKEVAYELELQLQEYLSKEESNDTKS